MNRGVWDPRVTRARHEVILTVLHSEPRPWPIKDLLAKLTELHERGQWPQATWARARNEPYYGGLAQMLRQMKNAGMVEEGFQDVPAAFRVLAYVPTRVPLRKRAAEALQLSEQGLNGTQIAERLGISTSLASSLINDPTGEKEKQRKKAYCPVCGGKLDKSVGWCVKCKQGEAANLLPPGDFRVYITKAAARGLDVLFGVTPDLKRVIRMGTERGYTEYVLSSYETWDEAVEECGLDD